MYSVWPQVTRPGEGTVKCTILLTLNYQVEHNVYTYSTQIDLL